jgi:hypothetical protein
MSFPSIKVEGMGKAIFAALASKSLKQRIEFGAPATGTKLMNEKGSESTI